MATTRRTRLSGLLTVAALALACTACLPRDVGILASDDMQGRDSGTPGGIAARDWILSQIKPITRPANFAAGNGGWLQDAGNGYVNVVGIIRGTSKPNEYVAVGAHYDHLGNKGCRRPTPGDTICNGALDNGTGVAAMLALVRRLADHPPKRSIIVGFWDGEEDGYVGSRYYVKHPLVPLARTVVYLNADMIGENLVPSLHSTTFALGAEYGGARLKELIQKADDRSPLDYLPLSRVFSQDRSDHASFLDAGVPAVFFGDGGGGCYHTPDDEIGVVDFAKLTEQTETIIWLAQVLGNTDNLPRWTSSSPLSTYQDVVDFRTITELSWPDRTLFSDADQADMAAARQAVNEVYEAGADAYDGDAQTKFLTAVIKLNTLLGHLPCDGYFPSD